MGMAMFKRTFGLFEGAAHENMGFRGKKGQKIHPNFAPNSTMEFNYHAFFRTRRIGADPEKSDLVNFRGPDWRTFSELCVLLFFLGKTDNMLPKSRFSKPIFGHSAGSTKLDRPYCKRFWFLSPWAKGCQKLAGRGHGARPLPKSVFGLIRFRLPPPIWRLPVISFKGERHRPDQSHFLRSPRVVLESTLSGMFPPPNGVIRFAPFFSRHPTQLPDFSKGSPLTLQGVRQVKFGVKNQVVILNSEPMKAYETWFWVAFCSFTQDL